MKQFKRITGLMLAMLLIVSMVPINVLAEPVTYTGLDVRVCNTAIGKQVKNADLSIQLATDEQATMYQPDTSVQESVNWYHTVESLEQITNAEKSEYTLYQYGTTSVYARDVQDNEVFVKDEQYLCVITLTPTDGTFLESCQYGPLSNVYADVTTTKVTAYVSVVSTEEDTIEWVNFKCTNTGIIQIKDANPDYIYVYETSDGSEIVDSLNGAPVGKHLLHNAEYQMVTEQISVTNQPCITVYAVPMDEWYSSSVSAIVAYGTYTIPMSDPYIEVDTLTFGQYITITEIGTTTGGKYHWSIANATFEGWFIDKEGTKPATAEADAYVIFNLRSYGLFNPDIEADDFTLKCGNERYTGAYLFPKTSSNAYKIAFFIPSNRISFTLEVVGGEGSMSFANHPGTTVLSLKPLESGKYPSQDILMSIEPGYYAKSLKVNGVEWDDVRNPFGYYSNKRIMNDTPFKAGIPSFEPVDDTVITLELAPADRITIDYGDNQPAYIGDYADEYQWHSNGQYWVAETYTVTLCATTAFNNPPANTKQLRSLNTKPDGTGIDLPTTSTHFIWEPLPEYQNGKRDEITLYAIMECKSHVEYGAVDNAWEYREEKAASCTEEGWIEHRYCPNCGQYQIKDSYGDYVAVSPNDVKIAKLPHQHTVYLQHSNEQHIVQCANCEDNYKENHNLDNGVCVCGYFTYIKGDVNNDGIVDDADVEYLLYYTIFPDEWPVNQPIDFNGDGAEDDADAEYLLYYTIFPEDNPLN